MDGIDREKQNAESHEGKDNLNIHFFYHKPLMEWRQWKKSIFCR